MLDLSAGYSIEILFSQVSVIIHYTGEEIW